jgi:hypothetical protein
MPSAFWLLLAGLGAFLVYKSGQAAATSATSSTGGQVLSVKASNGQTYSVPIDANLPLATQQQIQKFFGTAGQTDATVTALATQLTSQGYTVAAGSVQSVWQMIVQAMPQAVNQTNPTDINASAGAGGGGMGTGGGQYGLPTHTPSPSPTPTYSKIPTPIAIKQA